MASIIIARTIGGQTETAIQMANSTWARPVALPSAWSKVRVGIRFHMTSTGGDLTGGAMFAMGLCSGTVNQFGDATTQNFVGAQFGYDAAGAVQTYLYTTSSVGTPNYYLSNVWTTAITRVGTTNTFSAALLSNPSSNDFIFQADAAASYADRGVLFVDITKGSPNFSIFLPATLNGQSGVTVHDFSSSDFLNFMGQAAPAPTGYTNMFSLTKTLAVDEVANGTLNSVALYWNRVDALWEICDVALAVLA